MKRHALVVGINHYEDAAINDLHLCEACTQRPQTRKADKPTPLTWKTSIGVGLLGAVLLGVATMWSGPDSGHHPVADLRLEHPLGYAKLDAQSRERHLSDAATVHNGGRRLHPTCCWGPGGEARPSRTRRGPEIAPGRAIFLDVG